MKTSRPGSGKGSGRSGSDPHARKKTKRWREVRKAEQGGRGDDERRGGKFAAKPPSRGGAPGERKFAGPRPGGRNVEERSFEERRFEGRKPEGRKPEGRKPEGRKFEGRKPEGYRSEGRKFEGRAFETERTGPRSGERRFAERKPADFKSGSSRSTDHRAGDRKVGDRPFGVRKSGERKPADRKFGDRKSGGGKFGERTFGERSGGKPAPRSRGPRRDDDRGERFQRDDRRPPRGRDRASGRPRDRETAMHDIVEPKAVPLPTFESAGVQTVTVSGDEDGMRVDRFFEARFPGLSFSHIQRIIRKGEVRVDGKRSEPKARLARGQSVRIPPLKVEAPTPRGDAPADLRDRAFLREITLYEDDDVLVLNKPAGLAVQGGSGTTRHVDGMLGALQGQGRDAQRPRLVHRLDKDTAGCLLVAKTRFAAAALAKTFRSRSARKVYWALVYGVPKPLQGRVSNFLAKEQNEEDSVMRLARHGEEGASHAVTYYAVVETAAQQLAWVSLKPVTGRTHQLRAHMQQIGHPILGDPKYFNIENWTLPGGIQNKLHLLARRIAVPHPRGGRIDITAPLPPHMQQTWNLIGLDMTRYDPIEDAPEE